MAAKSKLRARRLISGLALWSEITREDLEDWADSGSFQRGEAYYQSGNVESLALTSSGVLLAWVRGKERYAVEIAPAPAGESPKLASLCTCYVGYACKHAVAAALAFFEALDDGRTVPTARPNDLRLRLLQQASGELPSDDASRDDFEDEQDEEETMGVDADIPRKRLTPAQMHSHFADLTQEELVVVAARLTNLLMKVRDQIDDALAGCAADQAEPADTSARSRGTRQIDESHRGPRLARHR